MGTGGSASHRAPGANTSTVSQITRVGFPNPLVGQPGFRRAAFQIAVEVKSAGCQNCAARGPGIRASIDEGGGLVAAGAAFVEPTRSQTTRTETRWSRRSW